MSAYQQPLPGRILTRLLRPLIKLIYKVRVIGMEHLPREGGVIIASNHMSYMDAVLLGAICPRTLQAFAWGGFQEYAIFRFIYRAFGALPVTPENARASLKEAVRNLEGGGAILIFPEGQVTRTGEMQDFAGGFNLLARHANVPVVPVYIEGMWGSIFSFKGGKVFWKRPQKFPYPVTVHFGQPLSPQEASIENLRQAIVAFAPDAEFAHADAAAKPLQDFGEAEFRARPELAVHLGEKLVRSLRRRAGEEVVVDHTGARKTMTGAKLLAVSLALASRLRRQLSEPRVGIVLPPGLGGLIANYAVMLAGKTPVNLNFTIGKAALESSIRKAGVRTTLTSKLFREKITAKITDLPWSEDVRDLQEEIHALPRAALLFWLLASRWLPAGWVVRLARVPREGGDREAALLFTSGSVGEPKGVVLTHRNILGNGAQIDACGIIPVGESVLGNLPIFHSFGFTIIVWYAIQHGVKLVTVPSPLDVRKCVEAIAAERVTILLGTPTFFRPYLKRAEPAEMASVRYAIAGAEKTPKGFHEEWQQRFGGQYCEGYGLTETSPVVSVNLPAQPDESPESVRTKRRAGSVGRLFPGMAARIVDPETAMARGFNETGMLLLRGVNIFPGYLDQPEATAAALKDGWFVTGDLAKIDEDGFIYIEGRLSRFSKIGGEMVPHGTVEAAIIEALALGGDLPMVAISARHDAAKGEALVMLTTAEVTPEQVREKLAARGLPNLWIPRIVKRVDAIPLLGTGKLDLKRLRELAAE